MKKHYKKKRKIKKISNDIKIKYKQHSIKFN